MNGRLAFLAFALAMLFASVSAETLFQRTFAEMGYDSAVVDGPQTAKCVDFSVVFPQELLSDKEVFAVASINAEFLPVLSDDANLSISLNGEQVAGNQSTKLYCKGECWLRVDLDKAKILPENTLSVCVQTSDSTPKIIVSNDSMVGLYKAPRFLESDFVKSTNKASYLLGETATVSISLKNSGSEPAFVQILHIKPAAKLAREYRTFNVLEGESEWKGFINPGEQKTVSYTIKPADALTMTLPPAIAYFKNEFGDELSIVSNPPTFTVREPEKKLSAIIVLSNPRVQLGENAKADVLVKNSGKDALYGLSFELVLPEGVEAVSGETQSEIGFLASGESEKLSFRLAAKKSGTFSLGCAITFSGSPEKTECEPNSVEFSEAGLNPAIIVGAVLLAIGAGVYFYLKREG